jgi:uncharacterized protein
MSFMEKHNVLKVQSRAGRYFIFDALTNNIFEIEDYEDINELCSTDLGNKTETRSSVLEVGNILGEITRNAKTLIIELTESCNFRCSYCMFDDQISYVRNHSNNTISLTDSIVAIKNFLERTNQNDGYIVFYGGEPLLAFQKMQEIVDQANRIANFKIKYSFSTNGFYLSPEKFDFLIHNDFHITVSLDGDEDIHDKQRKTNTGGATFDFLIGNLNSLKEYNDLYFTNNVSINCVISNKSDIIDVNKFFEKQGFSESTLRFCPTIQDEKEIDNFITDNILQSMDMGILGVIERNYLNKMIQKFQFRKLDSNARNGRKICIPFANRTYVRTDGTSQYCERVGEHYKSVDITDTESLVKLSNTIFKEFKDTIKNRCSKCFAYNFCEICPASLISENKYSQTQIEYKCNHTMTLVRLAFRVYIEQRSDEQRK